MGAQRRVGRKSWGSWQQTGETEMESKGGARHLAIILGHLAEGIAWGYQEPRVLPVGPRPLPGQDGVAKGKQLLPSASSPLPHHPVVFSFKVP